MSAKTLYARQAVVIRGREYEPGDELPELGVRHVNGFDLDPQGARARASALIYLIV